MLKPTKHTNPNKTVLSVSYIILKALIKQRVLSYDRLYALVQRQFDGAEALFTPSVSFLYSLGLLEYRSKTDVFEYVGGVLS
ncbi:MAG: hypothetical protein NZ828_11900 [Alphaproteobacteria bacterium]|nr:hypothetical protein [Alphaproteobacteria bacterium]